MRVLVTGSRMFHAGYRIDRALVRASAGQDEMTVITVGRWRDGAEAIARDYAGEFGWDTQRVRTVSEAQADICIAFLHMDDPHDEGRIVMLKAEKAGIPVWRYYEGGPRQRHPEPGEYQQRMEVMDDDYESDLAPWAEELLLPAASGDFSPVTFIMGDTTYQITFDETAA